MVILKFLKRGKKIKKFIKISCIILLFLIIIFIIKLNLYDIFKDYSNINNINIISEDNLINEIKNTNKIIPLEVELSKSITIDKSLGNLEIFEKYKRIKFFANCSYYIDLSKFTDEDIQMDEKNTTLNITIPEPKIFNINILREKTIYEDTSNGLLRFGDIKLTSEEFDLIQDEVYKSFEETLQDKDIYNKALYNSKISLTNLLNKFISDEIKVNISFK
ncbi:DUF4230 domain-containing protein [Clostridium nigeriense]|uniref:DUF4230 domain-containing protein n=1 Tax=Clostridium nigeriense TaxID=1805470 RepID=UPI00082AA44A|nr:DUF4230 domain-containing protein [Clostridium nigeriense]